MPKILQGRLQQYVDWELPEVQVGFRRGRGTRDQIANMRWIMEKAREFQKKIYFCFIDYAKAFDCVDHSKLWQVLKDQDFTHLTTQKPGLGEPKLLILVSSKWIWLVFKKLISIIPMWPIVSLGSLQKWLYSRTTLSLSLIHIWRCRRRLRCRSRWSPYH